MTPYRSDGPQTLGDLLARMKPLPAPPPWADGDAHARTERHNEALTELQTNALVARKLAENAITRGGPFPDSLLHFVPGGMVGSLAAPRGVGSSNPSTDQPSGSSNDTADPWASYGKSAVVNAQNSNSVMPPTSGNSASTAPAHIPPSVEGTSSASSAPPATGQRPAAVLKGPVFPPIPPGVDIVDNMNAANAHRYYPDPLKYFWFYNQVHNRAPWDYKRVDREKYAPFGNFNFGATGAMLNIPLDVLLRMGGSAQNRDGNSSPAFGSNWGRIPSLFGVGGVAPYGDDPVDQTLIKKGFQYAQPFVSPPVVLTDSDGAPLYR
jgi:hypothetical protein